MEKNKAQITEKEKPLTPQESYSKEQIASIVNGLRGERDALENEKKRLLYNNQQLQNELQAMRDYLAETQTQSIFSYLNAAFKVIESPEFYATSFIETTCKDVEVIMSSLRKIILPEENKEDNSNAGENTRAQ